MFFLTICCSQCHSLHMFLRFISGGENTVRILESKEIEKMRTNTLGPMILGLAILLAMGAEKASAQFRVAPGPSGGFGGAGAYGAGGSLGELGSPGLGNGLGNSGLGNLPLPQNSYGP